MYCGVPKKRAAFSANRPNASSPNAPRCTCGCGRSATARTLEDLPDEVEDPALLVLGHVLAQLLVEVDADHEDDRRDVEERRQEVDAEQAAGRGLVVGDRT